MRPILASIEEHSLLARKKSESMKGNGLHLMEIEQLYHGLQGRTWLLLFGLRSKAPRYVEAITRLCISRDYLILCLT